MVVSGRVQGVCFRAYTQQQASSLGLTGYVRNLPDGGVEIVAEGAPNDLDQLAAWAATGPSMAYVEHLHREDEECKDEFSAFDIRY